jgi:hypothetical protein
MPQLRRVSDGEGFRGSLTQAIKFNEDGTFDKVVDSKPVVGYSFLVGTVSASSYSDRDYWMTTEVTEILEERRNEEGKLEYVKFKTKNSIYECFA